jgi:hypothetical protein
MKKLLIMAMLCTSNCIAQPQITWQKYFHSSTGSNVIDDIIEMEDSGFVATTGINNQVPPGRIIRLDKYGDTLWVKKANYGRYLAKALNGGYLCTGYTGPVSGVYTPWVVKLDANFDSLWAVPFPLFSAFEFTPAIDSGFILNGSSSVIKTDSLGNIEWTIGFPGTIGNVIPCANGDILVVGMGAGYNATYKAMLLTATGQVWWNRAYGMLPNDWGGIHDFGIKDAVELPDGNFMTAAGSYHPHINDSSGWDIIKLDRLTGDTLQTFWYDTITGTSQYFGQMAYAKDSNILVSLDGDLFKLKQDGSVIWFKHSTLGSIYDLIGCNDNGIAIAGDYYNGGTPLLCYSTYAKFDSLGNCYNFQGIPYITPQLLSIYPNPASNQLTASPLTPLLGRGEVTITVYDMLGKVQLQQTIVPHGDFNVDVNALPSGIYMLQLKQEYRLFNGRFIKE